VIVEEGELIVRDALALGSGPLEIRGGGRVSLDLATGSVSLSSLVLDVLGRLDLGSGSITIAAGGFTEETLRQRLIAGRNNGLWNGGTGIVSRTAAASPGDRSVGWMILDDGAARIAFSAPGDTNLDAAVDILDVANVITAGAHNTAATATWTMGDFNYDGLVNILDTADFLGFGLYDTGSYAPSGAAQAASLDALSLAFAALADPAETTPSPRKKLWR
jgi:hypothetical protein